MTPIFNGHFAFGHASLSRLQFQHMTIISGLLPRNGPRIGYRRSLRSLRSGQEASGSYRTSARQACQYTTTVHGYQFFVRHEVLSRAALARNSTSHF
jgi:hypothetical protein